MTLYQGLTPLMLELATFPHGVAVSSVYVLLALHLVVVKQEKKTVRLFAHLFYMCD